MRSNRWFVITVALLLLLVPACSSAPAPAAAPANESAQETGAAAEVASTADETAASATEAESASDETMASATEEESTSDESASAMSEDAAGGEEAAPEDAQGDEGTMAEDDLEELDPSNFDDSTTIDNEWWPLKPGTQFVYEGFTEEAGEQIPHRIEIIVTDLTKVIDGVRAIVILEKDYSDDLLEEAELAFFAQDNDGNVWHLGQYREMYDEVEFIGGRVWLVGYVEGAHAGIMMPAEPDVGGASYSQGYAPDPFNWTDRARAIQMGEEEFCTPVDCYPDVLVTEEFNNEEPDAFQLKYYARGVGNVGVGWRGDDENKEELELVELVTLSPEEMAELRAEALELEERAYTYGLTPPAEHTLEVAQE